MLNVSRRLVVKAGLEAVRMSSSLIAVIQLNAGADKEGNFQVASNLIQIASSSGAKMVFLPEAFDFICEKSEDALGLAEPLDGELIKSYSRLAQNCGVWLSLGGFHERVGQSLFNTHLIMDERGRIMSKYRKIHLFDVEIASRGISMKESNYITPGNEIIPPVSTVVGNVGLSIDLRFPEKSLSLKSMGAQILTYPSAFMHATGSLHWEVLLRARAIECQTYVVAAAQTGVHNGKRVSWGHSMVVDPNGTIIAQCSEGIGLTLASIDLPLINRVCEGMPVWNHKRYDLYPQVQPFSLRDKTTSLDNVEDFNFGHVVIKRQQLFYKTQLTVAFCNIRCVLPGHVLVAPLRQCPRLENLTSDELKDLMQTVQKVERAIEQHFQSTSSTITIQDGPDAGQTINHVHLHIIPRKPGDFSNNDDIYVRLEDHDKDPTRSRRTDEEMADEAKELRKYFL